MDLHLPRSAQLAFLHDALVHLVRTFDSILEFAIAFRKLADNLVFTFGQVSHGRLRNQMDLLADTKFVRRHVKSPNFKRERRLKSIPLMRLRLSVRSICIQKARAAV